MHNINLMQFLVVSDRCILLLIQLAGVIMQRYIGNVLRHRDIYIFLRLQIVVVLVLCEKQG